jgi:hypothetical protein
MSDEPEHKSPLEIIGDQVCEHLPESLRNDDAFVRRFGRSCGFFAGWIIGRWIVDLLFRRGDDK